MWLTIYSLFPKTVICGLHFSRSRLLHSPEHVWERYGECNEDPAMSYIEGAWLLKNDDTYYLTYAAPGTSLSTYAMGTYVSSSPLVTVHLPVAQSSPAQDLRAGPRPRRKCRNVHQVNARTPSTATMPSSCRST